MRNRAAFRRSTLLLLTFLTAVSIPSAAHAQRASPGSGEAATLAGRMRAFLAAVQDEPRDRVAAYFPRRGEWTWVQMRHLEGGGDHVGVWRFRAAETAKALEPCGPAGESFDYLPEALPLGVLVRHAVDHPTGWRRVRGNRFVPPGAPADSPVFVEWRREDGEWVVSTFGDEAFLARRLPSTMQNMVVRDVSPTPPEEAFAAGESWFVNNEPITFDGRSYIKYGLPHRVEARELTWIGVLGRIRVYAERGRAAAPEVLYVATAPGEFHPYQTYARVCP